MPLIVGQSYALWLLASGRSTYFQVMLMYATGVFLATLIGMFIRFKNLRSFIHQIRGLITLSGSLAFMLVFLLIPAVPKRLVPGTYDQPLFRMIDVVRESFTSGLFTHGLVYLSFFLGLSTLSALTSGDAVRWWYANMIVPNTSTFLALFVAGIAGFFVSVNMQNEDAASLGVQIFVVATFSVVRLFFDVVFESQTTPSEFETQYADYLAGSAL
ncbi:MAG: hypothetical protein ABIW82_08025 [Dokdonella sp.]